MRSVRTFKTPLIEGICNCSLQSSCMAIKTTLHWEYKTMLHGQHRAVVDETACYGCGIRRSARGRKAITLADREQGGAKAIW